MHRRQIVITLKRIAGLHHAAGEGSFQLAAGTLEAFEADVPGHLDGKSTSRSTLEAGEPLHRILRDRIPTDYVGYLKTMLAEGASVVHLLDHGEVRALAVWRSYHSTYEGHRLYVDDLVTSPKQRSRGYGRQMMAWLRAKALRLDCEVIALDSGIHRSEAHRFYFRGRFKIVAFNFARSLLSEEAD